MSFMGKFLIHLFIEQVQYYANLHSLSILLSIADVLFWDGNPFFCQLNHLVSIHESITKAITDWKNKQTNLFCKISKQSI